MGEYLQTHGEHKNVPTTHASRNAGRGYKDLFEKALNLFYKKVNGNLMLSLLFEGDA
jgi:hypothetical protein